jgi:hypothetical protein
MSEIGHYMEACSRLKAERDRLAEALRAVVERSYCVRRDSVYGHADAPACGTCHWCVASAALTAPEDTP